MQKVLLVVGDASETLDTMYPYYRLQEAGFQPVVTAPEKREYQMVMHEVRPGWTITKEWEGYTIQSDVAFSDVDPNDYIGIFFSGGRAPEYIRYDEDLVRITKHFFEHDQPIASVCHGVEIPAYADCVRGHGGRSCPQIRRRVGDDGPGALRIWRLCDLDRGGPRRPLSRNRRGVRSSDVERRGTRVDVGCTRCTRRGAGPPAGRCRDRVGR